MFGMQRKYERSKDPVVRGTVGPDESAAVEREHHGKVLQRDVVDELVVRPLQEGRVDRDDRLHAVHREARGERDRVLLGDADVEVAIRGIPART
jgi:hypothetical protein